MLLKYLGLDSKCTSKLSDKLRKYSSHQNWKDFILTGFYTKGTRYCAEGLHRDDIVYTPYK